ncbi:MAG TPA: methyltransferase [Vicinamibacterales bacterium]|nr:methyltransferase [Vicinamibacterales bacterium]
MKKKSARAAGRKKPAAGKTAHKTTPRVPPQAALMQALFGMMVTKSISAIAELAVPDALAGGPLYYTDLAQAVGAEQRSLHRVMRMLSGVGIFAEPKPGTYSLTAASQLLRSDAPASLRDMAVMITARSHWEPWGRLADVLRSGASGSQHAFGTDVFTWFQAPGNEGEWQIFNAAMTGFSKGTAHAVAATVDFSRFKTLVDIGGGHGYLLNTILANAPRAKGIVYDLPGVVAGAPANGRIEFVGGDFFDRVPRGADAYVMKHIVHDWSDAQSVTLLSNVARAMAPKGRVFIVEMVMPATPDAHPAKFMDVNMLAMTEGGCERTEKEYAVLLKKAGLKLVSVHATQSPVSVIEAKKS